MNTLAASPLFTKIWAPDSKHHLSAPARTRYVQAMRARLMLLLAALCLALPIFSADPPATNLFNGKDLKGWKITDFGGQGEVEVKDGKIVVNQGASLSGVHYTNTVPTNNFQITVEAMKVDGDDFFCGLTFPVNDSHCTLVLGGWGGGVVGLSSIDGMDASENETTKYIKFEKNKWYKIKVEVRPERIIAWLDDDKIVDADIKDHRISLRAGSVELQIPLGLCTYQTTAAWRNIRLTPLAPVKKS